MAAMLKPGTLKPSWIKPSTILFAAEIPPDEKAFEFALAQAREFDATLILLHAYDTLVAAAAETSGIRYYDYAAAARAERRHLDPLAERVRQAGLACEVVVRTGLAADQILAYTREREIDRIVMGTRSPGHISKLLVGSVTEAVLRTAGAPVYIIGPGVVSGAYRAYETRTILCAVSLHETSSVVVNFAARLAAQHGARLILEHVIRPQERAEILARRTLEQLEAEVFDLMPAELREKIAVQTIVVPGDPAEELLYQSRTQQADLMVLGAQWASTFAAITRQGVMYTTLAHSACPVITLSPAVLAECGAKGEKARSTARSTDEYIAGVF